LCRIPRRLSSPLPRGSRFPPEEYIQYKIRYDLAVRELSTIDPAEPLNPSAEEATTFMLEISKDYLTSPVCKFSREEMEISNAWWKEDRLDMAQPDQHPPTLQETPTITPTAIGEKTSKESKQKQKCNKPFRKSTWVVAIAFFVVALSLLKVVMMIATATTGPGFSSDPAGDGASSANTTKKQTKKVAFSVGEWDDGERDLQRPPQGVELRVAPGNICES